MPKKKILYVGEASYTYSGYGTYSPELMHRLADTGRYELAELACSMAIGDNRAGRMKWKVYPNSVKKDDPRWNESQKPDNKNGAWRFDRVLLDFKPDFVFSIRDQWVDRFILRSPLRPYFNYVWMPTVDSGPSDPEWISLYLEADGVFTYSDWAHDLLKQESNGQINLLGSASPGVADAFKPTADKNAHKTKMGIPADSLVVGTVMRNFTRKLFPELIEAFKIFLQRADKQIADKSYLYLHTSYPDNHCWNIPRLLNESNIGHKVYMTYLCDACHHHFSRLFSGPKTPCPKCHKFTALCPNVHKGVNQAQLVDVYNCFDAYVQYSTCEGFGLPQIEAAACGVPVFAVDYSAMSDVVRKVGGYPIAVKQYFREIGTHCLRAYPDGEDFAAKLHAYFSLPASARELKGRRSRENCLKHYNWDKTVKCWTDYFDRTQIRDVWNKPFRPFQPATQIPSGMNEEEFVNWCLVNIMNRPDLINSYRAMCLVKDLTYGISMDYGIERFTPNTLVQLCMDEVKRQNDAEYGRCHPEHLKMPDYIKYANSR